MGEIRINVRFTLTPGDHVNVQSLFDVSAEEVPALPTAGLVTLFALACLTGWMTLRSRERPLIPRG